MRWKKIFNEVETVMNDTNDRSFIYQYILSIDQNDNGSEKIAQKL